MTEHLGADDPPIDPVPVHAFAGIELDLDRSGDGRGVATMPLTPEVRGYVAPLHGGLLATLVDNACAAALIDVCDFSVEAPVTTSMHVRYHRQPRSSPVTAVAEVVNKGSTLIDLECVVTDGGDAALARASASFAVVRGFGDLAGDG